LIAPACFRISSEPYAELAWHMMPQSRAGAQVLELSNREWAHAYRVGGTNDKIGALEWASPGQELIHFAGVPCSMMLVIGNSENILKQPGLWMRLSGRSCRATHNFAYEFTSSVNYLAPALGYTHYHHERWDGSGFRKACARIRSPSRPRLLQLLMFMMPDLNPPVPGAWSRQVALNHIQTILR